MVSGLATECGWMIKLDSNSVKILDIKILKKRFKEELDIDIRNYDELENQIEDNYDDLQGEDLLISPKFLDIGLTDITVTLFRYDANNGDCYDTLEHGQIYLWFEEFDLYRKTPTYILKKLNQSNLSPKFERWTVFG